MRGRSVRDVQTRCFEKNKKLGFWPFCTLRADDRYRYRTVRPSLAWLDGLPSVLLICSSYFPTHDAQFSHERKIKRGVLCYERKKTRLLATAQFRLLQS